MVGDDLFPSIYEMPRHVVDMTVSKQIGKRYTLKAGVSDLLNYRSRFVQDSNRDGKITGNDELISTYQKGAYYTFAVIVNVNFDARSVPHVLECAAEYQKSKPCVHPSARSTK